MLPMNSQRFICSAISRFDRVYEILTASKQSIVSHRCSSVVKSNSMNPWNCLTAKESRCCRRQIINAGAHLYNRAGLTPPIPGREPEDFFEYVEDNPALFYTRLQMPAMDQGTRITFYDALGFNPTARLEYRGRVNKTIEANGTVSARTQSFDNPALKQVLSYAGKEK